MAKTQEKSLAELTDKELMAEWTRIGKEAEALREKLKAFSQEHQKRTRLAQLNIEPGDLALLQEAAAAGIISEEAVN